jgi:signal-transduction protein with cAMP-binding, CBS, and nucleotidyltransferase domain
MGATVSLHPGVPAALVIREPLVRVGDGCSIGEAAQAMRAVHASSVLVGTEAAASSTRIVTERDLALALATGVGPTDVISQVATGDAVLVPSDVNVLDVAATLLRDRITHVLVVEEDSVIGALSVSDVLAVLLGSTGMQGGGVEAADLSRAGTGPDAKSEIWLG